MGGHEDASGDAQAEHDSPIYQKPVAESQAALCVARLPIPFQNLPCRIVASEQLHYALELSGFFDLAIAMAVSMCRRMNAAGMRLLFSMRACPAFSIPRRSWVFGASVARDVATALNLPKALLKAGILHHLPDRLLLADRHLDQLAGR